MFDDIRERLSKYQSLSRMEEFDRYAPSDIATLLKALDLATEALKIIKSTNPTQEWPSDDDLLSVQFSAESTLAKLKELSEDKC